MPERKGRLALFAALGIVSFLIGLYHWIFYVELVIERAGDPNLMDIVVGTVSIALVFLAGHVMMGASLPLICAAFLLYGLYGHYLPAPLGHRAYDYEQKIGRAHV